jgi:hypothetical protein
MRGRTVVGVSTAGPVGTVANAMLGINPRPNIASAGPETVWPMAGNPNDAATKAIPAHKAIDWRWSKFLLLLISCPAFLFGTHEQHE